MLMAFHAVDEDQVADAPSDRAEWLLVCDLVVKQQRDMRCEIATPRAFLEVLSKPAGAMPELAELLRGEAPRKSKADQ
jgi:hypothetical protein